MVTIIYHNSNISSVLETVVVCIEQLWLRCSPEDMYHCSLHTNEQTNKQIESSIPNQTDRIDKDKIYQEPKGFPLNHSNKQNIN